MRVLKRDGSYESVSFDKVLNRIQKMAAIHPALSVPVHEIAQKVCARIFDGVKTSELDELASQLCSSLIIEHPDYGALASRIIVSNHHKHTSASFSDAMHALFNHTDVHGKPNPLISDALYATAMAHKEELDAHIDYQRDYTFDYFGFKTLERSYLTRVDGTLVERPQHMWMRVALGIHGSDIREALLTYDALSLKYFTHATPTLFNAGTRMPQNSSCFLLAMHDDSVFGMYETLRDCALISKYAGGIGVHIHNIRAKGSAIRGTNGTSNGIIPMLRVFNSTARHIDQAGRRAGSIAVYLEPWHADVEPFLELKKNHGAEEERARDLFYAMWIPDLFMERVEAGGTWSLMCPDECPGLSDAVGDDFKALYEGYEAAGRYKKQVKAQDLWLRILQSQMETGTPYMCYKDAANKKSNQKNLGTIKSSNLCVAPETRVLTSTGQHPIADLVGQEGVAVWNGDEFSKTTVHKTGENQRLVTVRFSNGMELRCTPYHKFVIQGSPSMVAARDLRLGDQLPAYVTPVIYGIDTTTPLSSKQEWLARYLDDCALQADEHTVHVVTSDRAMLVEVQLLLQTLGLQSSFERFQDVYRMCISRRGLEDAGIASKRLSSPLPEPQYEAPRGPVTVVALEDNGEHADTYCFTEPKKNLGVFNGILAGNCNEIYQYTNPDEIAVCNLASICLPTYIHDDQFDFQKLHDVTKLVTKNLNKIIDGNLYPVEKAENSNLRHRPIGIGLQGLADTFAILKMNYDGPDAAALNVQIMETMYHACVEQSMEISKKREELIMEAEAPDTTAARREEIERHVALIPCERALTEYRGAYSSFKGSPASEGILQFDLWNAPPAPGGRYDWADLKAKIKRYGIRNSLLIATMPTASTSQIMGFNEATEAFTSNIYKRKTMAGEFIIVNKYLMKDLLALGLWTKDLKDQVMIGEGSIQGIEAIPLAIRERYKTVWEIKQKTVIDMAADRGAFVCQSQSMNLFVESPDFKRLTSMHFYAWKRGLKTGMYYLRTKPKASTQQFTIDPRKSKSNIDRADSFFQPRAPETKPQSRPPSRPASKVASPTKEKDNQEDDEDDTPQAVGCTWKPGCKTCSS